MLVRHCWPKSLLKKHRQQRQPSKSYLPTMMLRIALHCGKPQACNFSCNRVQRTRPNATLTSPQKSPTENPLSHNRSQLQMLTARTPRWLRYREYAYCRPPKQLSPKPTTNVPPTQLFPQFWTTAVSSGHCDNALDWHDMIACGVDESNDASSKPAIGLAEARAVRAKSQTNKGLMRTPSRSSQATDRGQFQKLHRDLAKSCKLP